ncbi:MAG TPA: hypothetical protein VGV93_04435 [Acidimicrobiales bacterium]|nr:hypothetical protein [Acidimicrobiales bacterium]
MAEAQLVGSKRLFLGTALAAVGLVATAGAAWAPHVPQLEVTPNRMRPGDQVVVAGTRGFGFTNPVEVRFNSPDGPVLGTFQPDKQAYAAWGPGPITIPADTQPGTYTLYATQRLADLESHIRGVPARMTIEVIGPGGPPVVGRQLLQPGEEGSAELLKEEGPSLGALLLVGLGVAGVGIFLAAMAVVAGNRRRGVEMERAS